MTPEDSWELSSKDHRTLLVRGTLHGVGDIPAIILKNSKDLQKTVNGKKDILGRRAMWFLPLNFPKASLVSFLWVVICVTEGRDHACSVVPGFPCPTHAFAGGTAGQLPPIGLGFLNALVRDPALLFLD